MSNDSGGRGKLGERGEQQGGTRLARRNEEMQEGEEEAGGGRVNRGGGEEGWRGGGEPKGKGSTREEGVKVCPGDGANKGRVNERALDDCRPHGRGLEIARSGEVGEAKSGADLVGDVTAAAVEVDDDGWKGLHVGERTRPAGDPDLDPGPEGEEGVEGLSVARGNEEAVAEEAEAEDSAEEHKEDLEREDADKALKAVKYALDLHLEHGKLSQQLGKTHKPCCSQDRRSSSRELEASVLGITVGGELAAHGGDGGLVKTQSREGERRRVPQARAARPQRLHPTTSEEERRRRRGRKGKRERRKKRRRKEEEKEEKGRKANFSQHSLAQDRVYRQSR
eukprot:610099-Hanusia_phi.AAC.1